MSHRAIAALFLGILLTTSHVAAQVHQRWNLEFPTSEAGQAQAHFLDAVTLMHLHMFEDAEEHFHKAQELAPDFAMAYWGAALNQHRTIWRIHRIDKAREEIEKLGPTPQARAAKAPTAREKDYLAAVEILFGEGTQQQREFAYSEAMNELVAKYPDDVEAKAWYALSLMRVIPFGMTREQKRSHMASLSVQVLDQNERHPGANRYLIQSTDDPENTDLGLLAVNNLLKIETDAAEALHIPSHYYMQHGMWQEVAESNMRAFDSSMRWVDEHGWSLQDLNSHNYGHLLQFANYGFLQSGNFSEAAKIRERVGEDYIASGLAAEIEVPFSDVNARWILDLENWELAEETAETAREYGITNPGLWQAIGIAAARTNRLELANEAVRTLDSAGDSPAGQSAVSARTVEGLVQLALGNSEIALNILENAADINWAQPVTIIGVPPRPVKPPMEVYAEALLEVGQTEMALEQFQAALTRYRGRTNLLLGAARAADQLGNNELASRYFQQLNSIWQNADSNHPFADSVRAKVHQ